ncbi:MAG TPA: response regulator [Terriglobales bacterium]|nr:response regulator [Terriglobales bacterium]
MLATNSPPLNPGIFHQACAWMPWICSGGDQERQGRPSKHKGKAQAHRTLAGRNRVLMLGSIRELALYRAEVLQQHGFHVQIATHRDQALDLIQAGNYDVVVLSYTLPDTAVREFADEMREHCPQCPVIAISDARRPDPIIKPDQMILADEGPAALLNALRHVLREH